MERKPTLFDARTGSIVVGGLIAITGACSTPSRPAAKPDPSSHEGSGGEGLVVDAKPPTLIDPAVIDGYVMSRWASPGIPMHIDARVTAVVRGDARDKVVEWKLSFEDQSADTTPQNCAPQDEDTRPAPGRCVHTIGVYMPIALPAPLEVGDRVSAQVQRTGGGPNTRYALVFQTPGKSLLLAVNAVPDDWKVTPGKAEATRAGASYDEQSSGVVFEHGGQHVETTSGKWSRLQTATETFYVWGSAVQRQLHGKAPADFVGSWLDSAVVRAR